MHCCNVVGAFTFGALQDCLAGFRKMGRWGATPEADASFHEEGFTILHGLASEASALLQGVWLVVKGAVFPRIHRCRGFRGGSVGRGHLGLLDGYR